MSNQLMRVLHIDSEKTWRGGENQMRLLIEKAQDQAEFHLAAPEDSVAAKRLSKLVNFVPIQFESQRLLHAAMSVARYVRQHKIDLIDCQTSRAHNVGVVAKFFVPKVKIVVHRRVDYPLGTGFMSRYKYFNRRVDRYVPISDAIAEILADYGIPKERMTRIYSAVDSSIFKAIDNVQARNEVAQELGIEKNKPLLINVAYHTPQKGMHTLLQGLKILTNRGIDYHCLLAGSGELTPELKALSVELGIASHVSFLGIRKDVPKLLAAADIFTMPSNKEGLGTSLLDAIHAGCPVAASDIGGIPEIIRHGETGLLSPVGDYNCLANNLALLIQDEDRAKELLIKAQAHAKQHFSVEAMVSQNIALYRQLLEPHSAQVNLQEPI